MIEKMNRDNFKFGKIKKRLLRNRKNYAMLTIVK